MISIIIPVYNEEAAITRTLRALPFGQDLEVIVVDGQSSDKTMDVVNRFPVKAISSGRGRAVQMNVGAAAAQGDVLLFLHADCAVDARGLQAVTQQTTRHCIGGCFTHRIDSPGLIYRWIEASGNLRAGWFKVFYGDQGIFVRRDVFQRIGGFDAVPLFEDALFSRKLCQQGKTIVLDSYATVLPRRWQKNGIVKTTLLNWLLTAGFLMGIPTQRLARLYEHVR